MPPASRKKNPDTWTKLAKAFYALDNKKKGDCGLTERQRAQLLITRFCEITPTNFYNWLNAPDKITGNHRYFIAVIINKKLNELFN